MITPIDFILHIDRYLETMLVTLGSWTYVVLFAIVFAETGLVVMPFLPGDSLLFAVGTLAGGGYLDVWISYAVLLSAAVLGDTVNYWIGNRFGEEAQRRFPRAVKPKHIAQTQRFFEKHGGKAIVLARFVPIVRTFAPFVAGVGRMNYRHFIAYNVGGAVLWVTLLVFAGYFFGGLPFVREHFEIVILGIIVISILPMVFEYWRQRRQ